MTFTTCICDVEFERRQEGHFVTLISNSFFSSFREGAKHITYYSVQLDATIRSIRTITIEV